MITVAGTAYTVMGLVILTCIAIGYAITGDGGERARYSFPVRAARYHLTRLRYARRMRGPLPARDQGVPYDRRAWLAILDAWDGPAAPAERTRT